MYVEKRGDKYRFFERYVDAAGKAHRVSVTLDRDTAQSRKKAREMLAAKVPSSSGTFREMCARYIEDQKTHMKKATWARNERMLNNVSARIGNVQMADLTAGTIRHALLSISTNPVTLNQYLTRVKAAVRWAYQNDYLDSTAPIDKIRPWEDKDRKKRTEDKYLEREELRKLLDGAAPDLTAIIEFLVLSGLRIGEMIALDKTDVTDTEISVTKNYDYVNDIMTTPKTADSVREVYVQPELRSAIAKINQITARNKMLSRSRARYFYVNTNGTRLSYCSLCRRLRLLSEKTIGREITPHALRHTHVSLLAEQGVPLETIARRLGHSSSKITREIYLHVTEKMKEKDRELVDKVSIL